MEAIGLFIETCRANVTLPTKLAEYTLIGVHTPVGVSVGAPVGVALGMIKSGVFRKVMVKLSTMASEASR